MSAFPPTRSTPSIPLPAPTALKYLQTYLTSLPNNSHLLPNARLSSSGPTAGSSTSSITIHNLERVEAGLRGEWLAPTLDLEEGSVRVTEGMDDGTNKNGGEGEWQDLAEYQRQQSIEGGDMPQDDMGIVQEGDSDLEVERGGIREEDGEGMEIEEDEEEPKAKKVKRSHGDDVKTEQKPIDKEARKREKKAREKELKRQKAQEKLKVAGARKETTA